MESFPSSLAVYLSNRCNLACSYCYVSVNRGAPARLDFDLLKRGLDYFLALAPASGRKVSFLGGEPLLDYPLVCRAVDYLRASAGGGLALHLFTNGVLLNRRRLDFFRSRGVEVVLSAHGGAGARWESLAEACLGASLVVTPQSTAGLLRSVDRLYRAGFRKIAVSPDVTCLWTAAQASRLGTALEGFSRYYAALARGGAGLFEISNIYEALARALGRPPQGRGPCDRLIFAADGGFYACDKMLGLPMDRLRPWRAGSPGEGLDAPRREAYFKEALESSRQTGGFREDACHCPVGVYTLWKLDLAPSSAGLSRRLGSFRLVSEMFESSFSRLILELKHDAAFRRLHHVED